MKTIELDIAEFTLRWRGGGFIAVWRTARRQDNVPDYMIDLPESIVKFRATREDIERIGRDWLKLAGLIR